MEASIEVLGLSGGDVPDYHEYKACSTGQRLHYKISVAEELSQRQYFDDVTVTLQGSLYSRVGPKAAVEPLLHLNQVRKRLQFEPNPSSKGSIAPSIHTESTFELPEVIPALDLSGTTSYTRSSTLVDRHQVSGQCNIRYWLEAEFKSNGIPMRRLICPVDFLKLIKPSRMTVLASGRASCSREPVRVQRRGVSFRRSSHSPPAMTFEIPHELGVIASAPKAAGAGHQRLPIPLTISMPQDNGNLGLLSEGIDNVSIQANWHTTKSFGTSRLIANDYSAGSVIRKSTIVRQKTDVSFPPFFGAATRDQYLYSSTTCLDLALPDSISDSSINTNLVSISYELELEAAFDVKMQNGKLMPHKSKMRIPLQMHMT